MTNKQLEEELDTLGTPKWDSLRQRPLETGRGEGWTDQSGYRG